MVKKIARILPLSMNRSAKRLALTHCRNLGLHEGTDGFNEEFENYIFDFNDEAYGLSLTPSGLIGQNPATPKIKEEYFREMYRIFGEQGIIQQLDHDKYNEYEKTKFDRVLRGNIVSLAHFILDSKFGLKIKGKNGKPSDFEYVKVSDDKTSEEKSRNEQVTYNQYLRMFIVIKITQALEEVMDMKKIPEAVMDSELFDKAFGNEWRSSPLAFLKKPENRINFVKYFYNKDLKKANPHRNVLKNKNPSFNVGKENLAYFVESVGIYFDKEKIDSDIEIKTQKGEVSPSPISFKDEKDKANFIKDLKKNCIISQKDIDNADMRFPIVFGTRKINDVLDNFVIIGKLQMLRALSDGFPNVDCITYNQSETMKLIKPSQKTLRNIAELNT